PDGALASDRHRVLADVLPHDVLEQHAALAVAFRVDVYAVGRRRAEGHVAQRATGFDAEQRALALGLATVAEAVGDVAEPTAVEDLAAPDDERLGQRDHLERRGMAVPAGRRIGVVARGIIPRR